MDANSDSTNAHSRWLPALVLVAISLCIHIWLAASMKVPSRDSLGFARAALQFDDPNAGRLPTDPPRTRLDVLRQAEHPPGFPVAVWLMSFPVREVYHSSIGEQFLRSAQVVNLLASVLLALVQFRLGRELFGVRVGFLAAALFQVLPVAARTTSDGLSEAIFLLALATALLFSVKAIRDQRLRDYLGCGAMTALAYLVRPEGMLVGLVVGVVLAGEAFARRIALRPALLRSAALVLGVVVFASPYVIAVGGITNKPTGQKLLRWITGAKEETAAVQLPLFAAWYVPGEDGSKPLWIAATLVKETAKSSHYLPPLLAIVGLLVVLRTRWRSSPEVRVPVLYLAAHAGLLVVMAASSGYLSERHTLPIVFVGCLFSSYGLVLLADRIAERRAWSPRLATSLAGMLIVLTCLPPLLRTRHDDRLGHVLAGRWLAEHAGAKDAIVDPFDWAQFFAGRTLYQVPPDPNPAESYYAVMEEGKSSGPRSTLPRHWYAVELAKRGQAVYRWPSDPNQHGTKVVIYRVTPAEH